MKREFVKYRRKVVRPVERPWRLQHIVDKLNKEINAGLADPRMKARISDFGYTVFANSPTDFGTFIAAYTEKWAKVIKFSGAKIY